MKPRSPSPFLLFHSLFIAAWRQNITLQPCMQLPGRCSMIFRLRNQGSSIAWSAKWVSPLYLPHSYSRPPTCNVDIPFTLYITTVSLRDLQRSGVNKYYPSWHSTVYDTLKVRKAMHIITYVMCNLTVFHHHSCSSIIQWAHDPFNNLYIEKAYPCAVLTRYSF